MSKPRESHGKNTQEVKCFSSKPLEKHCDISQEVSRFSNKPLELLLDRDQWDLEFFLRQAGVATWHEGGFFVRVEDRDFGGGNG